MLSHRPVQVIHIALKLVHAPLRIRQRASRRGACIRLRLGFRGDAILRLTGGQAHPVLRRRSAGNTGIARLGDGSGRGILPLDQGGLRARRRADPGAVLGVGFGVFVKDAARFRGIHGAHGGGIRYLELLPGAHQIHVVLDEGFGIGPPQSHQHLIDRCIGHRVALGNGEKVVAGLHGDRPRGATRTRRRAYRGRRHIGARAAQRHQNADLHLPLPRTGADIQQQIHGAAGGRLRGPDTQILARAVHAVFNPDHHAGQGSRRFHARSLPGGFIGDRDFQGIDFVWRQFLQSHYCLQRRAGHGSDTRMPHAHGQRRTANA
ncbi:hypothetical protein D3C86_1250290 [compost metagenome]